MSKSEIIRLSGLDDAVIGIATRKGQEEVLAYDAKKIIQILMNRDGMDSEEALEFFYYNIADAWMGEGTPVFIMLDEDILENFTSATSIKFH